MPFLFTCTKQPNGLRYAPHAFCGVLVGGSVDSTSKRKKPNASQMLKNAVCTHLSTAYTCPGGRCQGYPGDPLRSAPAERPDDGAKGAGRCVSPLLGLD